MLSKPETCAGCDLSSRGRGFVPPSGPPSAPILLLGESAGEREIIEGIPFVGPAGGVLHRLLWLLDQDRDAFRITNVISCQPPANKLAGMPWEHDAISHCAQYLDPVLAEPHKVVVPMGGSAIRRLLGITRGGDFAVEDFHGTCTRSPDDRYWIVPSYHPSHLQRGAMNLMGTVLWDLKRALDVAKGAWKPAPPPSLICDPPADWFAAWAEAYLAAALQDPLGVWLSTDCETLDTQLKSEGELTAQDRSYEILRANFACNPGEGISVPFVGRYIEIIRRLHASPAVKCLWNAPYDMPRYAARGMPLAGPIYDFMDGWHMLHSDVPKGLGFVAPYYCPWAIPWKHRSASEPALYGAFDGVNTHACAFGIAADLQARGMWTAFLEDMVDWQTYVARPLQEVGLLVDEPATQAFGEDLTKKAASFWAELQAQVPERIKPLLPKEGWKSDPGSEKPCPTFGGKLVLRPTLELKRKAIVKVCLACRAEEISKTHRCACEGSKHTCTPVVVSEEREVSRWFVRADFNPGSSPQKLALMAFFRDKPGRNKLTGRPSADRVTIEQHSKHSKSPAARPIYRLIVDYQSVFKVKTTYVDGTLRRLQQDREAGTCDGRLHPTLTNKTTTLRPSCTAPNLFNVRADKDGKASLAAGFKRCIIAAPGCKLVELDWVGQEAVFTGYYAADPTFIRLATLGIHDYFNSYMRGEQADLAWPDDQLKAFLKEMKRKYADTRDPAKRTVHGFDYGLTPHGMYERFPHIFLTLKMAKEYTAAFERLFPSIPRWQIAMMELANKQRYLGGVGQHPFGYLHEFWDVLNFRKINSSTLVYRQRKGLRWAILGGVPYAVENGGDANRVKAFFPQSTNAAVLRKTARRLFHPESPSFIGDRFYGRTPLRAPIYDSFLLELPDAGVERTIEQAVEVMQAPIKQMPLDPAWGLGEFLKVGVEVKIGRNWMEMEPYRLAGGEGAEALIDEEWEEEEIESEDWHMGGGPASSSEVAEDIPF